MKRNLLLVAAIFAFAAGASAQGPTSAANVTNYGGSWTLDVSKSKLGDRNNIQSQVVTAIQTATTIKIDTATKRTAPPADGPMMGGRGGMGGGPGPGDMPATYNLDGKESKSTQETPMGPAPVTLKAVIDGNKLSLTRTVTLNTQAGETALTTKETWELSSDGSTLTITTDRNTPQGPMTTTRIFTKKT